MNAETDRRIREYAKGLNGITITEWSHLESLMKRAVNRVRSKLHAEADDKGTVTVDDSTLNFRF